MLILKGGKIPTTKIRDVNKTTQEKDTALVGIFNAKLPVMITNSDINAMHCNFITS